MKGKPRIVFDLDGVIHSYKSGWLGPSIIPDEPVEGIKETIDVLKDDYEIGVQSSRCSNGPGLKAVNNYLNNHNIYYDTIWSEKPPAIIYIDDRAICFDGNPQHLLQQIKIFKPWTEKDDTKPVCPFCGSDKIKVQTTNRFGYGYDRISAYTTCNCCHARGPVSSFKTEYQKTVSKEEIEQLKTKALNAWNIRN